MAAAIHVFFLLFIAQIIL